MRGSQNQPCGAMMRRVGKLCSEGLVARGGADALHCRKANSIPARTGIPAIKQILAILVLLFLGSAARAQETALYFTSSFGDFIGRG